VSARAVQVVTEVAALSRPFDYLVTDATPRVELGDRVRVNLNHRSVRGWVVGEGALDRELKPIGKWLGLGPPSSMLEVTRWAAWRWYGPWARFLATASPPRVLSELPKPPVKSALDAATIDAARELAPGVISLAPSVDPLGLVLGCYAATRQRAGSLLVVVPHEAWARRLRERLVRRGLAVALGEEWAQARAGWPVIVATRAGAFSPTPRLAGALVLDADDESMRSESAPTWNAAEVIRERCRRDDAPCWLTSVLPSPVLSGDDAVVRVGEARDWPRLNVVDRRQGDPHDGALGQEALRAVHRALDGDEPVAVAVILQRLGSGRLLACVRCGELASCAVCAMAEHEIEGRLTCPERHETRGVFCRSCGATKFRHVRSGVTTLARDVALQLGRPVTELTAKSVPDHFERVVVGTEAVLSRVRRAGLVVFADVDQYLLAPRASARRQALVAIARAGRLVGPRRDARGEVLVQTRRPDDLVLECVKLGDVERLRLDEIEVARALGLPPFAARASVSGEGAATFVARLPGEVLVRATKDAYVLSAVDVATLANALGDTPRPEAALRVAME